MKRVLKGVLPAALVAVGLYAATVEAAVVPKKAASLADKSFRQPELYVPELHEPLGQLPALAAGLEQQLAALGVRPDSGFYDSRSGRWSSLILTQPLVPGTGVGNFLRWEDLGASAPADQSALQQQVWEAVLGFLTDHQSQLRVDLAELAAPRMTVTDDGNLIQVFAARQSGGVPVRDSGLTAIINRGNLILFGLQNWADLSARHSAAIDLDYARGAVSRHASPNAVTAFGQGRLELIPTLRDRSYDFRLAWIVPATVAGDLGSWEGLVDAVTGELLAFQDTNQYASRRMVGGVFPVSNDGRTGPPPDGVEQAGWPMPFANVVIGPNTTFTSTGGSLGCTSGAASTTLSGQFIRISDVCGAINETAGATADFDLGTSAGTDCTVPAGHSAGDTHSARSGFYELNRIKEQAKGYLPANAWLSLQLTSNMNINQTCNAFWNGSTVNFYRDNGSACRNTGEIAAVFDHEWGHGLDNNGVNPNISSPGEGIADIRSTLRLNNSCVGRGFFKNQVCGGYGDPCTGNTTTGCTGIRDADFALHASGLPHGITWILSGANGGAGCAAAGSRGPCNRETHCEGQTVSEIAWDLQFRDLRAAPFNFDANTALELTTRIFYLGAETITSWYTCGAGCEAAGTCGCGATGGYLLMLAADDDNGSITDGTPHMQAIRAAFNRHQMACTTPALANTGCAGGPTAAPTVTATAAVDGVNLSWAAVPNASRYFVYRTEGLSACAFGKVKVGDVTGTTFNDTGLLSGRQYSYIVLPVGSNTSCFGLASACASATPTANSCIVQSVAPQALAVDTAGNGVFEASEGAVVVSPTWRNTGGAPISLTGAFTAFTGPVGPTYTITDATGSYGTIPISTNQGCTDCYSVDITSTSRPATHWDATVLETVTPTSTTKNWVLHVGESFTDVPTSSGFYRFIETILHKNVTGGCTATTYCPSDSTTREQMAVFALVSKEGSGYTPPACVAPNLFSDVPETSPFCRFIEELANRGVVSGCGPNLYCPTSPVTREQMAIFMLRTLDPALNPPACAAPNLFADVPESSPFCRWIEELANRGVVTGCGGGNYCPTQAVTREQMGVFLSATFSLTLYGL